jgi:hypothetical protein
MDKMISAYQKDCQLRGLAPKTIHDYTLCIDLYSRFLDMQGRKISSEPIKMI